MNNQKYIITKQFMYIVNRIFECYQKCISLPLTQSEILGFFVFYSTLAKARI